MRSTNVVVSNPSSLLNVAHSGTGTVILELQHDSNINVAISGTGQLILSGRVLGNGRLSISGTAHLDALTCPMKIVTVEMSGTGLARVYGIEGVHATMSGVGTICYRGPLLSQVINGLGNMEFSKSDMKQFNNEKIKKLECKFKQQTLSITTIEDFSNELFFQIFDYLDGCEIYYGFMDLNKRFQQLLNSSLLLFKINFDNKFFMNICKQIMTLNKHQIFSINSCKPLSMNRFFSSFSFDSSFKQLESLVLYESQSNILIPFLNNLSYLPRLFSLTLYLLEGLTNLVDIYKIILKLSMLKYLVIITKDSNLLNSLSINIDQQFNNITHLYIKNHCSFNDILILMSYTPQLHHICYSNMNCIATNIKNISPIKLSKLKRFFLCINGIKFDTFEIFLSKIDSKIEILSFTTRYEDMTYLDANRWQSLILNKLSYLKIFDLNYYVSFQNGFENRLYHGKSNQFSSSFWIERKWICEIRKEYGGIMYLIHPYKTRWDELILDETVNFSPVMTKSTQLILNDICAKQWRNIIHVTIRHALALAEIYHLTISVEKVFFGILIPILNSLPKLCSLKLHSLSFGDPEGMNPKDNKFFFSMKPKSKITKVYLERMDTDVDCIKGKINEVPSQQICFE
ncbi:unnamed protein product [Rotaria sordida]|uniref:Putative auto-transporter adhesin head GIN domain-containing protein n=2 Tax=Rotaria sordida TaxID=392033 RepID=A0A819R8K4_9BILA|nr:unnamed protein product [Rotaria sordida]